MNLHNVHSCCWWKDFFITFLDFKGNYNFSLDFVYNSWFPSSILHVYALNFGLFVMLLHYTYYVPITLLVIAWSSFGSKILANPKSDIFGFISESKRTLLAFKSLWTILSLECLWRYKSPCAMPSIIWKRFGQFSSAPLVLSERKQTYIDSSVERKKWKKKWRKMKRVSKENAKKKMRERKQSISLKLLI